MSNFNLSSLASASSTASAIAFAAAFAARNDSLSDTGTTASVLSPTCFGNVLCDTSLQTLSPFVPSPLSSVLDKASEAGFEETAPAPRILELNLPAGSATSAWHEASPCVSPASGRSPSPATRDTSAVTCGLSGSSCVFCERDGLEQRTSPTP
eukprot:CAMPEP_0194528606 /NCGR_PEP_ID=MMETSP0253-20130528/65045_1 /TAXON_ID=2966 /ORGANISM="Noctiluca scintillans" /LENGTH=152 /DNA_ID=CAMNT_0039373663 /DNA_START=300 /DNA_END=758 /DNA_ORIENTATION=-